MAENSEINERLNLDDDNYMEETDEDVTEVVEEVEVEVEEEDVSEEEEEQDVELKTDVDEKKPSLEAENGKKHEEDEDDHTASLSKEEKQKRAELLALPPFGSEVFIGGLPKDITEDDLTDLCDPIGDVFETRLMKNKETGELKGYAFVAFKRKEDAQNAMLELKNKVFKGKILRCSLSDAKNRLFIGNIPKSWSEEQFRKAIREVGPGAELIDLKLDALNPGRNRGFAFVDYYNSECADYSRLQMSTGNFKLEGNSPTVSWADPKTAPESNSASQVKALYVTKIPESATPEQLKELFQRHGEVTKVVLPPAKGGHAKGNFGFIHFAERSSALLAVKESEKYKVNGQLLDVTMAKPQTDKKTDTSASFSSVHPFGAAAVAAASYLTQPQFGFAGNPYGSILGSGYGVASGIQHVPQPIMLGRNSAPSNMQMMPMVLPDGQIGYVLRQPGIQMSSPGIHMSSPSQPPRYDRSSSSRGRGSGGGGGGGDDGYRSRRYRPY